MSSYLINLYKNEDPEGYAKRALDGMMLAFPVKIDGASRRPDNNISYHASIKVFNKEKDHAHKIDDLAKHLPLNPPDAKNTQIEPGQFKGKHGDDIFVIKLHGRSADKIKEMNAKFAGMGDETPYEYQAHISVDKPTWDKIKSSGAKTAKEAGIEFGNAELVQGAKVIKTYHHQPDSAEPEVPDESDLTAKIPYEPQMDKLAASEKNELCDLHKNEDLLGMIPLLKPYVSDSQRRWAHTESGKKALGGEAAVHEWDEATKGKKLPERVSKSDVPLEKGALKNAGIALGMAGALAGGAHTASAKNGSPTNIQHTKQQKPNYDHNKMMQATAAVESSGGTNLYHQPAANGEIAYGKYAMMPDSIKDEIKGHPDLRNKHAKALALAGTNLHRYLDDNKGLDEVLANRKMQHIQHRLKTTDPAVLGYAWFNGLQRTLDDLKAGKDIKNHWHAKKVSDAYKGIK